MKKITPVNMSQNDYSEFLIKSGVLTPERYLAAIIDNTYYEWKGRPPRANCPWCFEEDYKLISLLMEGKSPNFIGKVLERSTTAIQGRMLNLLGTSQWVKIVTLSESEKQRIQNYFLECLHERKPYADRINILETVTLLQLLEDCGFHDEHS